MIRALIAPVLLTLLLGLPATAQAQSRALLRLRPVVLNPCSAWDAATTRRNPTATELRCRHGVWGPGRFGLLSYSDVPVYQPATPLPGTHIVGVPGLPRPAAGESHEEWEARVLRTRYGPETRQVQRGLEVLDPFFAARLMRLERRLREEGIHVSRRETWRSPHRQAFLFQQGRSRSGALVTATLTSWHSLVDARGLPAARATDYNVASRHMPRFHALAREIGLESFGADSNDPGHVFLPHREEIPESEIVLLRLLPRVAYVTLATGRPVDEAVNRAAFATYRLASAEFAAGVLRPAPAPNLAGTHILHLPWCDGILFDEANPNSTRATH